MGQSRVLSRFKKSEKFGRWQDNCESNTLGLPFFLLPNALTATPPGPVCAIRATRRSCTFGKYENAAA